MTIKSSINLITVTSASQIISNGLPNDLEQTISYDEHLAGHFPFSTDEVTGSKDEGFHFENKVV